MQICLVIDRPDHRRTAPGRRRLVPARRHRRRRAPAPLRLLRRGDRGAVPASSAAAPPLPAAARATLARAARLVAAGRPDRCSPPCCAWHARPAELLVRRGLHAGARAALRACGARCTRSRKTENSPPLWYVVEWVDYRLLGTGAVALRLPSALAGIALVPVAWAIGDEICDRRAPRSPRRRSSPSARCSSGTRRRRASTACSCSPRRFAMLASCGLCGSRRPCVCRIFALAGRARPAHPLLRRVPARRDGPVAALGSAHQACLPARARRAGAGRRSR